MRMNRAALLIMLISPALYAGNNGPTGPMGSDPPLQLSGGWQTFSWNSGPNAPDNEGAFTVFTYAGATLKVTDAFCKGDVFRVFDNGVPIFDTTTVPVDLACTVSVSNPDVAFADPTYSHGSIQLGSGAHSITIQAIVNPFSGGAAFLRVDGETGFVVSYAANLAAGDSFINITNTGASGAALQSGTTASITGALCANVYAFTPDEQLVSCCSCPVTPNGLVSLSAKNDLASNTLTPAVPTALVVKILATRPVSGSCTNSAAGVVTATGGPGILAFGTKLHATPTAGTFGVTETPFSSATLSAGELSRIGQLCNFILANGSGFGVCRSCRLGGLGAERQ